MLASIAASSLHGIDGTPVTVEVHISNGLPAFNVVGLPDAACRESRDRVRAAFLSSGLKYPMQRITINLAPSGLRKSGSALDLPIAVGLMVANGDVEAAAVERLGFLGELGLDGTIRPIEGCLPLVSAIERQTVVVPRENVREAELVDREIKSAENFRELYEILANNQRWKDVEAIDDEQPAEVLPDLADVRGQEVGKFALEVAAAGAHHLLLVGPPGSGKSMLARRMPSLLPALTNEQMLESAKIYSVSGKLRGQLVASDIPPFRSPHHSATSVAVLGGGSVSLRPGEISLAHHGVLFLDEFAEFAPSTLEALRQPLEDGFIVISRANANVIFPACFQLVAAMNPCPCGEGSLSDRCVCSDQMRARYQRKLSGPLLDRIDIRVQLIRPEAETLMSSQSAEPSSLVRQRVKEARSMALNRQGCVNNQLLAEDFDEFAPLTLDASRLILRKLEREELSARGMVALRRLARTVADLTGQFELIEVDHVATALEFRADRRELQVA